MGMRVKLKVQVWVKANFVFAAAFIAILVFVPGTARAISNATSAWYDNTSQEVACSNCHSGNNAASRSNATAPLAQAIAPLRNQSGNTPATSVAVIEQRLLNLTETFLRRPSLVTLTAHTESGTVLTWSGSGTFNVPADTEFFTATFSAGEVSGLLNGYPTAPFSLSDTGFSSSTSGVNINESTNRISIPTNPADRSSYSFTVQPENASSITGSSTTVNIATANVPPVANPDNFGTLPLSELKSAAGVSLPYELDVLNFGSPDEDPDGANSSLRVSTPAPTLTPSYGTLTVNAAGDAYEYTAPETLNTTPTAVTFQYAAVDGAGDSSTLVTSRFTVPAGEPDTPERDLVANNDVFEVDEDGSLEDADVKVSNGSGADDLDGAALSELTFRNSLVDEGTLAFRNDGTFDYSPPADFNGVATFTYTFTDGSNVSQTATVTLNVAAGNDAPTVRPIELLSVNETADPFTRDLIDPQFVRDPEGDPITVQNVVTTITPRPTGTAVEYDEAAAVSRDGSVVTIDPGVFEQLDSDEFADIEIAYEVSDGQQTTFNTLFVTINGLDADLTRVAGAYADTLSARYTSDAFGAHFPAQASGQGSCLNCHSDLSTIDVQVRTVDQCVQSPNVFTQYGLDLCLNREASAPPLTDLIRRMAAAEADYAPVLAATETLQVQQSAGVDTPVGAPLTTSSTGRDVFGAAAQISTYLINTADGTTPGSQDPTGQFKIGDNGQISVAGTLTPGTYTFAVLPVNDAGQRDNNGARLAKRGFYNQNPGPESAVTIEVIGDLPVTVDDSLNARAGAPTTVAVLANDAGGTATNVTIVTQPTNGAVSVNADQSVTYTANADYIGSDSFTYTSRNARGISAEAATVAITVVSADAVIAVNDSVTAVSGRETVIDVLANDDNVRRSGTGATVVTITSSPDADSIGSLALSGQSITFTPVEGFNGTTSFTYRAENPTATGSFGSTATVTLAVSTIGGTIISDQVTDPELLKVAQAFEQSCVIVSGFSLSDPESQSFLDVCTNLTVAASNGEDLTQAMQALRNEEALAVVDATATVARGLGRVVERRLTQIRDGAARGFNTSGVTLRIGDQTLPTGVVARALQDLFGVDPNRAERAGWGIFVAGDIAWTERDETENASDYDLEATNLMIGYDRILNDRQSLGIALGYAETTTEFGGGGSLESEGFQATLYGVQKDFLRKDLTFEGYFSVGQMDFTSDRRINFTAAGATVDTFANAVFDGTYINIKPTLSYSRVLGDFNDPIGALRTGTRLTWSVSLDYLWMDIDEYTETGGNGLGLNVQSETYESLILAFGVDASRPIYLGPDIKAEIFGGLEVRGELLDKNRSVSSSFAIAGAEAPRFLVTEEGTYGLGAGLEVGTMLSVGTNGQFDITYGYDIAGGGLSSQNLTLGYRHEVSDGANVSLNVSRNFNSLSGDGTTAEFNYRSQF